MLYRLSLMKYKRSRKTEMQFIRFDKERNPRDKGDNRRNNKTMEEMYQVMWEVTTAA